MKGCPQLKSKVAAGLVPKSTTIGGNFRRGDAVEDDDSIICQYRQHLLHDFLEVASVSADEYGIWARNSCDVRFEEVADVDVDAWGTKLAGILMDDGLTLRADLEGFNL